MSKIEQSMGFDDDLISEKLLEFIKKPCKLSVTEHYLSRKKAFFKLQLKAIDCYAKLKGMYTQKTALIQLT